MDRLRLKRSPTQDNVTTAAPKRKGSKGKGKKKEKHKHKAKEEPEPPAPKTPHKNGNNSQEERPMGISKNSKHANVWGSDGEDLPSVFHAWIKLGIPKDSLRASEWGGFTSADKEVSIRVSPSGEGPLMLIEEEGVILFKSEPRLLREVSDSSRYFSLKVPKSLAHPEDFYVGIAFNDRKDSGTFVRKLWSVLRGNSLYQQSQIPSTIFTPEEQSFWLMMSDELVINIFRYLDFKELSTVSETCSRWNIIANDKFLWKGLCQKYKFKRPDEYELKYKYHNSYKLCFIQRWRILHPPKVGAHAPKEEELLKYTQRLQFHGQASLKLVCVGSCGSEKTKLLLSYVQKGVLQGEEYIPTVFDNYTLNLGPESLPKLAEDASVELSLWDTAGQDEYDRLRPLSYANASVFLVLFSLVNPASFENVRTKWHPEVKHFCPDAPILLVGVHAELRSDSPTLQKLQAQGQTPVSTSDALREASFLGFEHYIECSVPTGENVNKVFELAVYSVLIRQTRQQEKDKGKCLVC